MSRQGRRRRRLGRLVRFFFILFIFAWFAGLLRGEPMHYLPIFAILPLTLFGGLVALPFIVLALVVAVAAMAIPLAVLGLIFGGPWFLVYRMWRGDRRQARAAQAALSPDEVLRRRYVAGELTYQQFQDGMLTLLKERFAGGQIGVAEYEAELEKLLEPARRIDLPRGGAAGSLHAP